MAVQYKQLSLRAMLRSLLYTATDCVSSVYNTILYRIVHYGAVLVHYTRFGDNENFPSELFSLCFR